jgi:uncharacterized damage-inducible protein DinB
MNIHQSSIEAIYSGWRDHQALLIAALSPLTPKQLALKPAPNLRSIEAIATHMIGARARWFAPPLGDGSKKFSTLARWDRRGGTVRTAAEIVQGLQNTGDYIHSMIGTWSPEEWEETYPGEVHEPEILTRPWIIWHLIEHDLHHGGEISIILGMHKLKAPDL